MRWIKSNREDGETRVIRTFLLFPKILGDEMRWLEWANIKQEWTDNYYEDAAYWRDIKFVDEDNG